MTPARVLLGCLHSRHRAQHVITSSLPLALAHHSLLQRTRPQTTSYALRQLSHASSSSGSSSGVSDISPPGARPESRHLVPDMQAEPSSAPRSLLRPAFQPHSQQQQQSAQWQGQGPSGIRHQHASSQPCAESTSGFSPAQPLTWKERLQHTMSLHASAMWTRHKTKVYAGTAIVSTYLAWRATFFLGTNFLHVAEDMAEWGCLGLSVGLVTLGGLYLRWYYGINPVAVYHRAMMRLSTSPAVLEVMGVPLVGSELRAYVVTGGNLYLSHKTPLWPKISSKRLQMIFPLHGSERDGLASVEVKRRNGRYVFNLLAVDIRPVSVDSPPVRLFVEGDHDTYARESVLAELRDPFLKALSKQKHVDKEHELEDDTQDTEETEKRVSAVRALLHRLFPPSTAAAAAAAATATADAAAAMPSQASEDVPSQEAPVSASVAQAGTQTSTTQQASAAAQEHMSQATTQSEAGLETAFAGTPRMAAAEAGEAPATAPATGAGDVAGDGGRQGSWFKSVLFGPKASGASAA